MSFVYVTTKLLEGFGVTCLIFIITLACSIPLGLVVAFGSMSNLRPLKWLEKPLSRIKIFRRIAGPVANFRPIRALVKTIVWIIRGTPLMLQIMVVFYGPGLLWEADALPRMTAVLIAFIINYSCYFSEIYRGGIEGVSKGQYEAGQVLGMTRSQIFFKIILLQVIKRIVPPMGNEIITLVKDTSLARIIAVREIIMEAQTFISVNALIWPLFYSGAFYLLFCGVLTILFGFVERKMEYFRV